MIALANPIGDFPLNDDWVYGLAVKSILEQGEFRMPSPASTDLFPQAYWGALFCLPFGFSFTALRVSTLVLGLVGILATYGIVRQLGAGARFALLAAALVAGNPLYFALANTFMTDVPFLRRLGRLAVLSRAMGPCSEPQDRAGGSAACDDRHPDPASRHRHSAGLRRRLHRRARTPLEDASRSPSSRW